MSQIEGFSANDFKETTLLDGYRTGFSFNPTKKAKENLAEDATKALEIVPEIIEGKYPAKNYNLAEDILDITDAIASLKNIEELRIRKPDTADKIEDFFNLCATDMPIVLVGNHVKAIISSGGSLEEKTRELDSVQAFLRVLDENGVIENMTDDVKKNLKQVLFTMSQFTSNSNGKGEKSITLKDAATIHDRNVELALELFDESDTPPYIEGKNVLVEIIRNYFKNGFGDNWHKLDLLEKFVKKSNNINKGPNHSNDLGFKFVAIITAIRYFQNDLPTEGIDNIWDKLKMLKKELKAKHEDSGRYLSTVYDADKY